MTPEILFTLAAKNQINLPKDDPAFTSPEALLSRYDRFANLDDFLGYYYIGMSVLIEASDYEALAWDYFEHAAKDGVMHTEMVRRGRQHAGHHTCSHVQFFDPQAHLARGVSYDTVLTGFSAARKRAGAELGITSELICCFLRHLPPSDCVSTFKQEDLQASFRNGQVIGIGLDSSEKPFPPHLFEELYRDAKALGLRCTAHAGEEGPSGYIKEALSTLGVERIDHGIHLADDEELMETIAYNGTLLSVCPLSNVVLRCVGSVGDLPLRKFADAGVQFSINSDDPGNNT